MRLITNLLFVSLLTFASAPAKAQDILVFTVELPNTVPANTPFPIAATSRGSCTYPYPENIQAPDFELTGNQLSMTVYLRFFGQNTVPVPPCVNRTQVYTAPALRPGIYQLKLFSRFYMDVFGSFGERRSQGETTLQVAEVVPITQIPATSSWSLALLLLGMIGAARWTSGVSGK